jgi:hypothetical protein
MAAPLAPIQAEPAPIQAKLEPEDLAVRDFNALPQEPVAAAEPKATAWDQWHALSASLPDTTGPAVIYPPTTAIDL